MNKTDRQKEVTVVIPQFGQSAMTLHCVRAILEYHPHMARILIVDDGSPDVDMRNLSHAQLPLTEIVRHRSQQGVTQAWNTGLRHSRTDTVVFLNNDVVTSGPWMNPLVAPLHSVDEGILLTGAASRREQLLPKNVPLLEGWCLAGRTELLRRHGGFDPRFRLYFSDTDLQWRLLLQSPNALRCVGNLPLQHLGHATTRHESGRRQLWETDRQRFVEKWL